MLNLTDETFHAERQKPGYFVADFWSVWCPPCKAMAPIFEEVADKYPQVRFAKVNVTENQELAQEYRIDAIPAFLIFKDGELVFRFVGLTGFKDFSEALEGVMLE